MKRRAKTRASFHTDAGRNGCQIKFTPENGRMSPPKVNFTLLLCLLFIVMVLIDSTKFVRSNAFPAAISPSNNVQHYLYNSASQFGRQPNGPTPFLGAINSDNGKPAQTVALPSQKQRSNNESQLQQMASSNSKQQLSNSRPQPQQQQPTTFSTMSQVANNQYEEATNALLLDLRLQILNRAFKFDDHFRSLLTSSKRNLHNMFVDTYGLMYEQNAQIFTSMFESLEQYYSQGRINLTKSLEQFFERLTRKIFQVYNSNNNREFPQGYYECAAEQLNHLKPFKDAPDKLIKELRHTFVAARTFYHALNAGIDVIKNLISLGQPAQCTNLIHEKLLKHQREPLESLRPPCTNYCEQVITRCVGRGNLDQLSERWKAYVSLLAELAKKLSVHYNIETIIAPLDVQISEAIMNFQEGAPNMTQYVYQACSHLIDNAAQPTSSGHHMAAHQLRPVQNGNRIGKRSAPAHSFDGSSVVSMKSARQVRGRQTLATSASISPNDKSFLLDDIVSPIGKRSPIIIDEIRDFMLSTRNFWSNFPKSICMSNYTLGTNASTNAANTGNKRQQPNCFTEPLTVADVNSDLRYRTEITQQVHRLDLMNSRIESSLTGVELDWSNGNNPVVINPTPTDSVVVTQSTTTSTTASIPDSEDDESSEDDPIEPGSGGGSEELDHSDSEDEPLDETDDTDDETSSQPDNGDEFSTSSSSPTPLSPPEPPTVDETYNPDNNQITLIPAQKDARTSSAERSTNLVIISETQFLLGFVATALSIVSTLRRYQVQVIT